MTRTIHKRLSKALAQQKPITPDDAAQLRSFVLTAPRKSTTWFDICAAGAFYAQLVKSGAVAPGEADIGGLTALALREGVPAPATRQGEGAQELLRNLACHAPDLVVAEALPGLETALRHDPAAGFRAAAAVTLRRIAEAGLQTRTMADSLCAAAYDAAPQVSHEAFRALGCFRPAAELPVEKRLLMLKTRLEIYSKD